MKSPDAPDKTSTRLPRASEAPAISFSQFALENTSDGAFWSNQEGVIEFVNLAAAQMLGYTREELVGRPVLSLVTCLGTSDWQAYWARLKSEGRLCYETEQIARDGRHIPVEVVANHMVWEGKDYKFGFVRNIADRKRAEELLRASEAQHRNLLLNLNAGVVVHAPDTTILLNNHRALEILGLSPGQMSGKVAMDPTWRFLYEDGQTMLLEDYPVMRVRSTLEPLRDYLVGMDRPHGGIAWALVNAFPEFDDAHHLLQIVVTFVDITARKLAESRLAEQLLELRARHDELDRFNRAMVNRELRMLELKQEINRLLARLGESPRYTSVFGKQSSEDAAASGIF
jgi:PAS domain S-box-containing protein